MTIYLVRHGSAGTRNIANSGDAERELDETGRAQAQLLADWLGERSVTSIVSSPYPRCVQTVAPLSEAIGVAVATEDTLKESSDVHVAWKTLMNHADEVIRVGGEVVICSHGDVIPDLIRHAQLRGMRVHGKSGCSKGSVWELNGWDGERFESGSYTVIRP